MLHKPGCSRGSRATAHARAAGHGSARPRAAPEWPTANNRWVWRRLARALTAVDDGTPVARHLPGCLRRRRRTRALPRQHFGTCWRAAPTGPSSSPGSADWVNRRSSEARKSAGSCSGCSEEHAMSEARRAQQRAGRPAGTKPTRAVARAIMSTAPSLGGKTATRTRAVRCSPLRREGTTIFG